MISLTEHDADDRPLKRRQDGWHRDELEAPLGHQHRRGRGQELAGVAVRHRQAEEAGSRQSSNRLSIVVFRLEQTLKIFFFIYFSDTYFYARLIEGAACIFPNSYSATGNRTHDCLVAPL